MTQPVTATGPSTFRGALESSALRRLLLAHALATVAQLVVTLAVGIEVLARTDSPLASGLSIAVGFVPYALFSGYAGTLADRFSRSAVLAVSALIRVGLSLAIVAGLSQDWTWYWLVTLVALLSVAATPSYPALAAATVQCVESRQLPAANALATSVENVGWIAGPGALAALHLAGVANNSAIAVMCLLFGLAGTVALSVGLPRSDRPSQDPGGVGQAWRALIADPKLRSPMLAAALNNFLYGYLVVAIVLLSEADSHSHVQHEFNAALTGGALVSLLLVNRIAASRSIRLLGWLMVAYAAALLGIGLLGADHTSLLLIAVAGGASLVAEVLAVTLLQQEAEDHYLARLFGVYDQINVGAIAAGSLLAGVLADLRGPGESLAFVASTCLVLSGAVLVRLQLLRRARR